MNKYYHVWFQTKYKKYILIDVIDESIHIIIPQIAKDKGLDLISFETMPDHMHLLLKLGGNYDLTYAVKVLKGISSRRIFQEYPLLKHQFHTNNLWAKGFGYREIPELAVPRILGYIRDQKEHLHIVKSHDFNRGWSDRNWSGFQPEKNNKSYDFNRRWQASHYR